jgi:hypothetical protein
MNSHCPTGGELGNASERVGIGERAVELGVDDRVELARLVPAGVADGLLAFGVGPAGAVGDHRIAASWRWPSAARWGWPVVKKADDRERTRRSSRDEDRLGLGSSPRRTDSPRSPRPPPALPGVRRRSLAARSRDRGHDLCSSQAGTSRSAAPTRVARRPWSPAAVPLRAPDTRHVGSCKRGVSAPAGAHRPSKTRTPTHK